MSGVLAQLDTSPRSAARRGVLALVLAAAMELAIVAIAEAAEWPSGPFYMVSAMALAIFVAIAVPIIEPPRTRKARGRAPEERDSPSGNTTVRDEAALLEALKTVGARDSPDVETQLAPDEERIALVFVDNEKTAERIAATLGVSVDQVHQFRARGKRRLAEQLGNQPAPGERASGRAEFGRILPPHRDAPAEAVRYGHVRPHTPPTDEDVHLLEQQIALLEDNIAVLLVRMDKPVEEIAAALGLSTADAERLCAGAVRRLAEQASDQPSTDS